MVETVLEVLTMGSKELQVLSEPLGPICLSMKLMFIGPSMAFPCLVAVDNNLCNHASNLQIEGLAKCDYNACHSEKDTRG